MIHNITASGGMGAGGSASVLPAMLNDLVQGRIFPKHIPASDAIQFPCVTYSLLDNQHGEEIAGPDGTAIAKVIYDIFAIDNEQKLLIARLIRETLSNFTGLMGTRTIQDIELIDTADRKAPIIHEGREQFIFHRAMEFDVLYELAKPVVVFDPADTTGAIESSLVAYIGQFAPIWPDHGEGDYPHIVYDRQGGQGQRPLTCCSGKDFQQEVVVPGAAAAFADDAVFAGMLLQER